MKEELLQQLSAVLGALNAVSVSGKQNLTNLSGSIAVLEQISAALQDAEIHPANTKAVEHDGRV